MAATIASLADGLRELEYKIVNNTYEIANAGGAAGVQYAEDAAHVSGNTGTLALVVRQDTAAALAGTDGDYIPLIVDSTGRLWAHIGAIEAGANIIGKVGIDQTTPGTTNAVALISGQAGVAGGAGAVGATVQRMTLASDDPAVASLSVVDDWDESDRAKVNPIAGQAGVAGGSGVVGATTQRVTLATDVALPTGTNSIGQVTANAGTNLNTSSLATSAQIGEVQASPTANTVLDRLKALLTGIVLAAGSAIIGKVGVDQTTPGSTNATQLKQYSGVPSSFAIQTTDQTVFTLAAGEIGFVQNLHTTALAVKKGASASTTSLSLILPGGSATDDGKGGPIAIDDWVGAVSVAAMSGSPRYVAWKQAAS